MSKVGDGNMYQVLMVLSLIAMIVNVVLAFLGIESWIITIVVLFVGVIILGILSMLYQQNQDQKKDQALDEQLKQLFQYQKSIPMNQDVSIVCRNPYTHYLNLEIHYQDESICTLSEMKESQSMMYQSILKNLLDKPIQKPQPPKIDAQYFINVIDQRNVDILDEQVTRGLYETTALLKHIHYLEETYPSNASKLYKLYQYYLPILIQILTTYTEIDEHTTPEDQQALKERLLKTILLSNEALKSMSDTLIQEKKMDLSSNMSTLEAILKKDGLLEDDFVKHLREREKVYHE